MFFYRLLSMSIHVFLPFSSLSPLFSFLFLPLSFYFLLARYRLFSFLSFFLFTPFLRVSLSLALSALLLLVRPGKYLAWPKPSFRDSFQALNSTRPHHHHHHHQRSFCYHHQQPSTKNRLSTKQLTKFQYSNKRFR